MLSRRDTLRVLGVSEVDARQRGSFWAVLELGHVLRGHVHVAKSRAKNLKPAHKRRSKPSVRPGSLRYTQHVNICRIVCHAAPLSYFHAYICGIEFA